MRIHMLCSIVHSIRILETSFISRQVSGQTIEVKTPQTHRDYTNLLSQADVSHHTVYKTRRCFLYQNQYFQMDIYKEPGHQRCKVSAQCSVPVLA